MTPGRYQFRNLKCICRRLQLQNEKSKFYPPAFSLLQQKQTKIQKVSACGSTSCGKQSAQTKRPLISEESQSERTQLTKQTRTVSIKAARIFFRKNIHMQSIAHKIPCIPLTIIRQFAKFSKWQELLFDVRGE